MANTKPQIKELDCTTGEEIVRDATAEEILEIKARAEKSASIDAEEAARAVEKQAILDRIGLTADELKMILG